MKQQLIDAQIQAKYLFTKSAQSNHSDQRGEEKSDASSSRRRLAGNQQPQSYPGKHQSKGGVGFYCDQSVKNGF
jgi:hypothetical protein